MLPEGREMPEAASAEIREAMAREGVRVPAATAEIRVTGEIRGQAAGEITETEIMERRILSTAASGEIRATAEIRDRAATAGMTAEARITQEAVFVGRHRERVEPVLAENRIITAAVSAYLRGLKKRRVVLTVLSRSRKIPVRGIRKHRKRERIKSPVKRK